MSSPSSPAHCVQDMTRHVRVLHDYSSKIQPQPAKTKMGITTVTPHAAGTARSELGGQLTTDTASPVSRHHRSTEGDEHGCRAEVFADANSDDQDAKRRLCLSTTRFRRRPSTGARRILCLQYGRLG